MPRITHFACALSLVCLSVLLVSAQAQTPTIDVTADSYQVQFAAHGEVHEMHVEVYAPSGELVFDSGIVRGPSVEWNMQDGKGQRVTDGVYLATLSLSTSSGQVRKRVEPITISRQEQAGIQPSSPNVVQDVIMGAGTSGRVAKFTAADTIADSIVSEDATNIGINTNPDSVLHILGIQPTAAAGNGTAATRVLNVVGGKGGDTTGAGTTAGVGASVTIMAGVGGNAPAGSTNGRGGNINIQPGAPGVGAGTAANYGNLFLSPKGGNVGVGTTTPTEKLTVAGLIQIKGTGNGIKFADNSVQTTAASSGLASVAHNATLSGDGTSGSPLGVTVPLALNGSSSSAILQVMNTGSGAAISATKAINTSTQYNIGGQRVLSVPLTSNSFVGVRAGLRNTMGGDNSFFGYSAGFANTTGSQNSFFGSGAGYSNTTGFDNTFVGVSTGLANTTGDRNSFFGHRAGVSNTTGILNSFFGINAGADNTRGIQNSFFGQDAGIRNTTGDRNAFFGSAAGMGNTTGYENTFLGSFAGSNSRTGRGNTVIGASAGVDQLGNDNTLIGYQAQAAEGITNSTAIGANARVTTSNTMVLGTDAVAVTVIVPGRLSVGTLSAGGSTQVCRNFSEQLATCSSSLRYKTEVQPFISGLEIIHRLRPISFTWRDRPERDLGLAAEEVAEVEPLLVTRNAEGTVEGVKYDHLNVVLINAIKQQQSQITEQEAQNKQQQAEIKQQRSEIDSLKKLVCEGHPQAQVCQEMK